MHTSNALEHVCAYVKTDLMYPVRSNVPVEDEDAAEAGGAPSEGRNSAASIISAGRWRLQTGT